MEKELSENKTTVGLLFQAYAKVFPGQKVFWLRLAKEEEEPAKPAHLPYCRKETQKRRKPKVQK